MSVTTLADSTERLDARLLESTGVLNRGHAQFVAVIAHALAEGSWGGWGITSPTHWLTLRAGLSPGRAGQVLAIARRWGQLPVTTGMFLEGRLSLEQVGVIARSVPEAFEASVADMAQYATVPQLRRATRHYTFEVDDTPYPAQPPNAEAGSDPVDGEPVESGPVEGGAQASDAFPTAGVGDLSAATAGVGEVDPAHPSRAGIDAQASEEDSSARIDSSIQSDSNAASEGALGADLGARSADAARTAPVGRAKSSLAVPNPVDSWSRQAQPGSLSMRYTQAGRFALHYEGPAEEGALIESAIREVKDTLWRRLNHRPPAEHPAEDTQKGAEAGASAPHSLKTSGAVPAEAAASAGPGVSVVSAPTGEADMGRGGTVRPVPDPTWQARAFSLGPESDPRVGQDLPGTCFGGTGEQTSVPVSTARAFVELMSNHLNRLGSAPRRQAYRVYVHLDTHGGWLSGRPRLPRHVVDKLTCDGTLQPLWHTDGHPVNVGRSQRTVPARTRRLILDRDRGCRFPGCTSTWGLECHHIVHWLHGEPTDTWNLLALCACHHDAHHNGQYTMRGNPDLPEQHRSGLRFTTSGGVSIGYRPPPAPRPGAQAGTDSTPYPPPTGQTLHLHNVWFRPHQP